MVIRDNENNEDGIRMTIQRSREDLLSYAIAMSKGYKVNWHHDEIGNKLMAVERGEIKRLIIEVPPRHGKSLLASVLFPSWYLGRDPRRRVILASYSGDLAVDFGWQTREQMTKRVYGAIFPGSQLQSDNRSKNDWRTTEGGGYLSVGVGGSTTGRGADLFLIDDPVKDFEEAMSETMRNRVWNWFMSVARTRLQSNASIVIIMTRWHTDDLAGRVLESGGDRWERVRLPFLAEVSDDRRRVGEALWPEMFPVEHVEELREESEYIFQCLYQQNPIASELQEFRPEYFRYFDEVDIMGKDLYYYVSVDLAISQKRSADNTSIVVCGKTKNEPEIYVIEEDTGKYDPLAVIEKLFQIKERYRNRLVKVGIEGVAYQKALEYFLLEEQRKRGEYFTVVTLKPNGSKEKRIMGVNGLLPLYKAGVIYHRRSMKALEGELLVFPVGRHDDRVDALAYQLQLLENTNRFRRVGRERVERVERGERGERVGVQGSMFRKEYKNPYFYD